MAELDRFEVGRRARFWASVDSSGGLEACWLWTLGIFKQTGYGQGWDGSRPQTAHRLAWIYTNGDPGKKKVLHRCPGGPNRLCCNPAHLAVGSDKDNADDRRSDGNTFRGEQVAISKLTDEVVREARLLCAGGMKPATLARRYGVSLDTMVSAIDGDTWAHVDVPPVERRKRKKSIPRAERLAILSSTDLPEVVADRYSIKPATVLRIWRDGGKPFSERFGAGGNSHRTKPEATRYVTSIRASEWLVDVPVLQRYL